MTSRKTVEDEMLALLRAALPAGVQAASLPARALAEEIARLNKAAVYLVYLGGEGGQPADMALFRQADAWRWAAIILAKDYRSAQARGAAALDLLDLVVEILSGAETSAGRLYKTSDAIMDLDERFTGVVGYQAVLTVETAFRKG